MIEHGKNMGIPPSFGLIARLLAVAIAPGCGKNQDTAAKAKAEADAQARAEARARLLRVIGQGQARAIQANTTAAESHREGNARTQVMMDAQLRAHVSPFTIHHSPFTKTKAMAFKRWLITLLSVLAAAFSLCANAQDQPPEYQLGPGDTIRIQVFQNPDLTLETRVSENGTISYPLIGSVRIGGMSLARAEQMIANALKSGGFIKQPQVSILLQQNRANQVSVLGHVNRPGRFPLETSTTKVSEMVAIAGGITTTGGDVIVLSSTRNGVPFRMEIDISNVFTNNNPKDDVVVAGGDEIFVPRAPMFYIYGEVQRPGSYRLERGMTMRQALATGGGPTPRGTERNLRVSRRIAGRAPEMVSVGPNDLVRPDDVLHVRESMF